MKKSEQKIEWHTFVDKNTRTIRMMVRRLSSDTDPTFIIQDLGSKGLKIVLVTNILKTIFNEDPTNEDKRIKSHVRLRLFMLTPTLSTVQQ